MSPVATAHRLSERLSLAIAKTGSAARLAAESALWAVLMAASASLSLALDGWHSVPGTLAVAILFGVCAFLAYAPSVLAASFLAQGRGMETRFAAHLLALAAGTVALTALVNGLWLRAYFATWHAEAFSLAWSLQFVFTVAGGAYQFAMFGLRLYLPIGFPALLAFALWRTTRTR